MRDEDDDEGSCESEARAGGVEWKNLGELCWPERINLSLATARRLLQDGLQQALPGRISETIGGDRHWRGLSLSVP